MNANKLIVGFLLLLLATACYKDKGNYDYKEVNDFKIVITPAPLSAERNTYLVNQPGAKADTFSLTAGAKQTLAESNENLEYVWYRTLTIEGEEESYKDTIVGAENTMELTPQKVSTWSLLLVVRDKNTDIEYYQSMTVQTKTPFANAWLYMYGNPGERKLGALQFDIAGNPEVIPNILEKMGQPEYPNMTGITYVTSGAQSFTKPERLFITSAPDEVTYINPFTCEVVGRWREMGIPNVKIKNKVVGPSMGEVTDCCILDVDGQAYCSTSWGEPYFEKPETDIVDYAATLAYMTADGSTVLWDNNAKRLMYYSQGWMEYVGGLGENDLKNKKVLWLGRGVKTVYAGDGEPTLFIMKNENNDKCYLYTISANKDGKAAKGSDGKDENDGENTLSTVVCDSNYSWRFDENTLFATNNYYQDQLFYTANNVLYRATLASGESFKLYEPENGRIKQIAFRLTNASRYEDNETNINYNDYLRVLALIVTKSDGTDEIHEIHLSNGGDVIEEHIYDLGTVSISDWVYTGLHRNPDNK